MYAIQFEEIAKDEIEAIEMLESLKTQVDYLGGRILKPSSVKGNVWRIQSFFEDSNAEWLPDGCRRVFIPDGLRHQLGIKQPA